MSYVIYNKETTKIIKDHAYNSSHKTTYLTLAAAKAAMTRFTKKGMIVAGECAVAEYADFSNNIEAQVKRVNMMSGKEYYESVNTPSYCSPSSESYWSM